MFHLCIFYVSTYFVSLPHSSLGSRNHRSFPLHPFPDSVVRDTLGRRDGGVTGGVVTERTPPGRDGTPGHEGGLDPRNPFPMDWCGSQTTDLRVRPFLTLRASLDTGRPQQRQQVRGVVTEGVSPHTHTRGGNMLVRGIFRDPTYTRKVLHISP